MQHLYDSLADNKKVIEFMNNIPGKYSDLLFNELVSKVHNKMIDNDLSLNEACLYVLEDKTWDCFELSILIREMLEEYDCHETGMNFFDFHDCIEEYMNDGAINRMKNLWHEKFKGVQR